MSFSPGTRDLPDTVFVSTFSLSSIGVQLPTWLSGNPSSGTYASANRAQFYPLYLRRPYDLQRFWWLNGATVGTDSIQAALYDMADGITPDCMVSTARTLSAGTVNQCQYAGASVVAHGITSGTNTTDATSFTTASVTLKARPGLMYTLSVVNTHGSSANTVTAATTGGALSFTSEKTVQFNGTLSRTTLFRLTPTSDVTDTIVITIGSAQTATACLWSLIAWTNVDTATNDGIVQSVSNTGSSTTPSVTLAAFGSANNATFGAHGTAQTAATPGSGFIEVHDVTASTPTCGLETEYRSDNDTGVDASITSAAWGSIAAEIKSLGTTRTVPAGRYFLGFHCNGTTATMFRLATSITAGWYIQDSLTAGLPLTPTFVGDSSPVAYVTGITNRATP